MSGNTFFLSVFASDKIFYKGKVQKLIIPLSDGEKAVLPHHEDMVIAISIGEMRILTEDDQWIGLW